MVKVYRDPSDRIWKAKVLHELGRRKEACRELEVSLESLEEADDRAFAHGELAEIREYMGQFSQAHLHYELAHKEEPKCAIPFSYQGWLFLRESNFENAIQLADVGLELTPSNIQKSNFCNLKAESFLMNRDIEKAEVYYRKAIEYYPNSQTAKTRLKDLEEFHNMLA